MSKPSGKSRPEKEEEEDEEEEKEEEKELLLSLFVILQLRRLSVRSVASGLPFLPLTIIVLGTESRESFIFLWGVEVRSSRQRNMAASLQFGFSSERRGYKY